MKRSISLFLSILLCSQFSFAECSKPVTYILEGVKASCTGYLFTPAQELEVRTLSDNYTKLLKVSTTQEELIGVMDKRIDLQMKINQNLRDQNSYLEKDTLVQKAIWFGLGVLSTGIVVYMTQRK